MDSPLQPGRRSPSKLFPSAGDQKEGFRDAGHDLTVIRSIDELQAPPTDKILSVCEVLKSMKSCCLSFIHGSYNGDTFFPEFEHLFHLRAGRTDKSFIN
jgi:hypothetical protein